MLFLNFFKLLIQFQLSIKDKDTSLRTILEEHFPVKSSNLSYFLMKFKATSAFNICSKALRVAESIKHNNRKLCATKKMQLQQKQTIAKKNNRQKLLLEA